MYHSAYTTEFIYFKVQQKSTKGIQQMHIGSSEINATYFIISCSLQNLYVNIHVTSLQN
jgi:hypothetical protein